MEVEDDYCQRAEDDRSVGKIIMSLGWRGVAATTIIIIIIIKSVQKQPLSMMPLTMTEAVAINNS